MGELDHLNDCHLKHLAELQGRIPEAACTRLSVDELWAVQRDVIDAAIAFATAPQALADRVRLWARDFSIGGADDLPLEAVWTALRPIVDAQSGRLGLDWTSPRLQALLPKRPRDDS